MTDRARNALIGLFALGGILCLTVLVMLFGQSRGLFQREYVITARFGIEQTPNLRSGTEVYLSGVLVGNVGEVRLVDLDRPSLGVMADLWIDQKYSVPKGSVADVETPLMGQSIVSIKPPVASATQPVALLPHDGTAEIRGVTTGPLDNILNPKMQATLQKTTQQVGDLAAALTPTAEALTELLQQRSIGQVQSTGVTPNLSTAVQRLYLTLTHIDEVIGNPAVRSNLELTLQNFRQASEGVKVAVGDLQQFSVQAKDVATAARGTIVKVDDTVVLTRQRIDELGGKLITDADKLSRLLDSFVQVGESLAHGEGTASQLLHNPKLYDELLLTLQRFGQAAADMQALIKQWQAGGLGVKLQ